MLLYSSEDVKGLSQRVALSNVRSMTFITDNASAVVDNIDNTNKTAKFLAALERT